MFFGESYYTNVVWACVAWTAYCYFFIASRGYQVRIKTVAILMFGYVGIFALAAHAIRSHPFMIGR